MSGRRSATTCFSRTTRCAKYCLATSRSSRRRSTGLLDNEPRKLAQELRRRLVRRDHAGRGGFLPHRLAYRYVLARDKLARSAAELEAHVQLQHCRLRSEVLPQLENFRAQHVRITARVGGRQDRAEVMRIAKRLYQEGLNHPRWLLGPFGFAEVGDFVRPRRVGHLRRVVDRPRLRNKDEQARRTGSLDRQLERCLAQHFLSGFDLRGGKQRAARGDGHQGAKRRLEPPRFHLRSPGPGAGGAAPRTSTDGSRLIFSANALRELERLSRFESALCASGRICVCNARTVSLLDSTSGLSWRLVRSVFTTSEFSFSVLPASTSVMRSRLSSDFLSAARVFSSSADCSNPVKDCTFSFTWLMARSRLTDLDGVAAMTGYFLP